tara:strand:+ start:300 stop:779 length:480 start_codon:yes stop_codon:yes gene_type:complete
MSLRNELRPYSNKVYTSKVKPATIRIAINRNTSLENRKKWSGETIPIKYKTVPAFKLKEDGRIDAYRDSDYVERPGSPKGVVSLDDYSKKDLEREKEYFGYAGTPDRDYLQETKGFIKGAGSKAYTELRGGTTGAKLEDYMAGNVDGTKRRAKLREVDI